MKKLFILIILALLSVGVFAAEKQDKLHLVYSEKDFTKKIMYVPDYCKPYAEDFKVGFAFFYYDIYEYKDAVIIERHIHISRSSISKYTRYFSIKSIIA